MGTRRRILGGTCKHGHQLTEANARVRPNGDLRCRVCDRERQRRKHGYHPRHRNRIGGTCRKGHPLTWQTVYLRDGYLHCVVCHDESMRRVRSRERPEPQPPAFEQPCSHCGAVLPLERFGQRRPAKDGSPRWHSWCGHCRSAGQNAREREARRERREREAPERAQMTAWIVTKVKARKKRGHTYGDSLRVMGVSRWTWQGWVRGRCTARMATIAAVVERLTPVLLREGLL
jgi:hypothetical protein